MINNLSYDVELAAIRMVISGYLTSQQFRALTEQLLEQLVKHQVNQVLADTREMPLIAADDQQWFLEDWLPRAMQKGFKRCAMINSRYFFNRLAISNIVDKMDKRLFTLQLFDDEAIARAWLTTQMTLAA